MELKIDRIFENKPITARLSTCSNLHMSQGKKYWSHPNPHDGIIRKDPQTDRCRASGIVVFIYSGGDFLVFGFGKFCVKEKAERKGRNPATGEDAILPARRVVTFKCSGKLRKQVNGK